MKALVACMMQYNKSVQLLPYDDKDNNDPLITPRDIPCEVNEYSAFVPYARVSKRNIFFMKFKIKSDMSLGQLKKVKGIMNFLEKWNVFLDQMY